MSKRAERRHHLERMKQKARRIYRRWGLRSYWIGRRSKEDREAELEDEARRAERVANHIKNCSCYMCGNPRKWHGELTIQEIKHLESESGGA